ncbi:MAG: amidohydrolase family protein [Bryobacterales bacterium]
MGRSLTVRQARLVLPDRIVTGDLAVEDGVISEIGPRVDRTVGVEIDGRNKVLLPGAVDLAVHVDTIEDLSALSTAAIAGGVTSVLAVGPAATEAELKIELARAAEISRVHAGLYLVAAGGNTDQIAADERARGVWLPGAVLHDPSAADAVFAAATRPIVVENRDPERLVGRAQLYAEPTSPADHTRIHDVDSAVSATRRALDVAQRHGRPTLLAHVSAAEELALLVDRPPCVSAAVQTAHLFLDDSDYARLGTRAVTCPALRAPRHREALWAALQEGRLDLVCSGHRPIRAEWKDRPYPETVPGLPAVQWTLPLLLDAVAAGRCALGDVARWTAEAPARFARLTRKGRLETGYDGDLVLVDPELVRPVGDAAGTPSWSPWAGRELRGWPVLTVLLGEIAHREGETVVGVRGRAL